MFGTSSPRADDRTPKDDETPPGPGKYDLASAGVGHWLLNARRKPSSVFASRSKRFQPPRAPTAPDYSEVEGPEDMPKGDASCLGPGVYDTQDPWPSADGRKPRCGTAAGFMSNSGRFAQACDQADEPGPGQYAPGQGAVAAAASRFLTNHQCGFLSGRNRFKGPLSFTPGPGHYRPGESSTMVKRSFNATVDGYAMA